MPEPLVETFANATGFPEESRFLDGHFAGNPIVPGAVLLAYLAARLDATGRALGRVERMKFRRTLLPGVPFEVRLTRAAEAGRAEFRDGTGVFATARVALRSGHG
jgi:3-hydroxymyristoyl/3-hydroxydecanoyl-(acyl carrier protein) dehydratase